MEHSNFPNFARGNVYLSIGNKQYSADVVVGITDDGKAVFYDFVNMREIKGGLAIPSFDDRSSQSTNKAVTDATAYEKSISQPNSEVNENLLGKSDTKPQFSIDKKHSDWDVCLTKEEQAMFCSKIGEIKQGKAAQFPESSVSRLKRQMGKESDVTERLLVIENNILYTNCNYINPQINDILTFEPVWVPTNQQDVENAYYLTEMVM